MDHLNTAFKRPGECYITLTLPHFSAEHHFVHKSTEPITSTFINITGQKWQFANFTRPLPVMWRVTFDPGGTFEPGTFDPRWPVREMASSAHLDVTCHTPSASYHRQRWSRRPTRVLDGAHISHNEIGKMWFDGDWSGSGNWECDKGTRCGFSDTGVSRNTGNFFHGAHNHRACRKAIFGKYRNW